MTIFGNTNPSNQSQLPQQPQQPTSEEIAKYYADVQAEKDAQDKVNTDVNESPKPVDSKSRVEHPFPGVRDLDSDMQYGIIDPDTYKALQEQRVQDAEALKNA